MKLRNGFVSNSSSSSFYLPKAGLTPIQIYLIINHGRFVNNRDISPLELLALSAEDDAEKFISECSKRIDERYSSWYAYDEWDIREYEDKIVGDTWVDNFDMKAFLECIEVNGAEFYGDNYDDYEDEEDEEDDED